MTNEYLSKVILYHSYDVSMLQRHVHFDIFQSNFSTKISKS